VRALVADYLSRRTEPWFDDLAANREVRQRAGTVTVQDSLRQAIELGHPGRVRAALAAGASPTTPDPDGELPLFLALAQTDVPSRVEVVAALLDAGANTADVDARGRCGLAAAASDRPAFVRLLLDRGASTTHRDESGATVLHHARGAEVTELLLDAGADALAVTSDGRSVLFGVADVEQLRLLLDAGADPCLLTSKGESALHQPLDAESVRLLLELGVAHDTADAEGRTPLMYQATREAMEILLDAGAQIDTADLDGRTTLHRHHSDSCTEFLLAWGADPLRKDNDGRSSLDEARAHDCFSGRYVTVLERAAGVERPKLPATPPPAAVASGVPPMLALASAALQRFVKEDLVALVEDVDHGALAEELADLLGGLPQRRDPGGDLSRWLLDRDEVEEVFATDDALLSALKELVRL
jgi:ankyrin repeat protein